LLEYPERSMRLSSLTVSGNWPACIARANRNKPKKTQRRIDVVEQGPSPTGSQKRFFRCKLESKRHDLAPVFRLRLRGRFRQVTGGAWLIHRARASGAEPLSIRGIVPVSLNE
jgi:hypothetical protein